MKFSDIYTNLTVKKGSYNGYEFSLQINTHYSPNYFYKLIESDSKANFLKQLRALQEKFNSAIMDETTTSVYIYAQYRGLEVYSKKITIHSDNRIEGASQRADYEEKERRERWNS